MVTPSRTPGAPIVLVVDDEPEVRRLAERILRDAGYVAVSAEDATEALELLARLQPYLDLVVTDIRMPGLNGDVMAAALHQQNPTLPILFISGTPPEGELPGPVLQKPFTPDQLVAAVQDLLSTTQSHWTAPVPEEVFPQKVLPPSQRCDRNLR